MSLVEIEHATDGVRRLRLNRPEKMNALHKPLRERIAQAVEEAESDGVKVVVFEGAGDAFCAGADVDEPEEDAAEKETYMEMMRVNRRFSGVVIGKLHGHVIGGGLTLALSFDLRYAEADTTFSLPEARYGYPFSPPTWKLLPLVAGEGRARELILTGRKVSATEAAEMGLVTSVHDSGTLDEAVMDVATDFVENVPKSGIDSNKRGLNAAVPIDW